MNNRKEMLGKELKQVFGSKMFDLSYDECCSLVMSFVYVEEANGYQFIVKLTEPVCIKSTINNGYFNPPIFSIDISKSDIPTIREKIISAYGDQCINVNGIKTQLKDLHVFNNANQYVITFERDFITCQIQIDNDSDGSNWIGPADIL